MVAGWLAGGEAVVRWATEPAGTAAITASGQKSSSAVVVSRVEGSEGRKEKPPALSLKTEKLYPRYCHVMILKILGSSADYDQGS